MGVEPKEEDIPKDPSTFSLEAQQTLVLLNALSHIWENERLAWKNYNGLMDIMDLYSIDKKRSF